MSSRPEKSIILISWQHACEQPDDFSSEKNYVNQQWKDKKKC